jgi:hypothetical protein
MLSLTEDHALVLGCSAQCRYHCRLPISFLRPMCSPRWNTNHSRLSTALLKAVYGTRWSTIQQFAGTKVVWEPSRYPIPFATHPSMKYLLAGPLHAAILGCFWRCLRHIVERTVQSLCHVQWEWWEIISLTQPKQLFASGSASRISVGYARLRGVLSALRFAARRPWEKAGEIRFMDSRSRRPSLGHMPLAAHVWRLASGFIFVFARWQYSR